VAPEWTYECDYRCRRCGLHVVTGVAVAQAVVHTSFGTITPMQGMSGALCESCQALKMMERL
jgi:hypothetical protein